MLRGMIPAAFAVMLIVVAGCAREDSCNIFTDGMHVTIRVIEEGETATVMVNFNVGGSLGTQLELGDCDEMSVNDSRLRFRPVLGHYEAELVRSDLYTFRFERDFAEREVYVRDIPGLPRVNITSPAAGTQFRSVDDGAVFRVAEDIPLAWENNDPESPGVTIQARVECRWQSNGSTTFVADRNLGQVPDTGAHTIPANTITINFENALDEEEMDDAESRGCNDVRLTLTRDSLDTELAEGLDGRVIVESRGRVNIVTNP